MTTIDTSATLVTMINVFTVEPRNAEALSALLAEATEQVMRHRDGFVSANIHRSTDGTRVINYGQWASAEALEQMRADPAAREHMGRCADLAVSFDPHLYTVDSIHHAAPTPHR
ncbi:MAG: antibiotic biosynthesis monooxygenase [Mycobacterium sp.]|jgi:quinol monooxygenase YgiN|nr:antibiotic biosynthesis monooxygenase [Mycobacterium sp.]